jgi:hypothetical protein
MYSIIILPVVLYGCETGSVTLREEQRLGVFGNWVLGKVFGLLSEEWQETGENCVRSSFMIRTAHQVIGSRGVR